MLYACRTESTMLSKSLSVLLVVYFTSNFSLALSNERSILKDYEHVEGLEGSYKFHVTPKNWNDAKQACADEDASLFYPKNSTEVNTIISFWKRFHDSTYPIGTWLYVGLSDIATEGVFATIDGKSISEVYNNWSYLQPDNLENEDCVHLNQLGFLNDIKCDTTYAFICEKKLSLERNKNRDIQQSGFVDYERVEGLEGSYKFHTTPTNWNDAKQACADEDASLFYPKNSTEVNTVISFWKRFQYSNYPVGTWLFVGLSDIATEGVFETIDGKSISEVYNTWSYLQPDNYENEDCVLLNQLGFLNDIKCDTTYAFICEKKLSLERNNNRDVQQSGFDYTFDKHIGKCYKLHTTPLNWTEADAVCQREQAHLAVISNQREAKYLANLTQSTPNPRIKENYQRGVYHVGFHNQFNEGWKTVRGTAMDVAEDVWWDSYKPADDRAQCGSMFYTGRLVNTDCGTKSFFICEHNICEHDIREHDIYSS